MNIIEAIGRFFLLMIRHRPWYKAGDVLDRIDNRTYESWESKPLDRIQIEEVGIGKYRIIDWWDLEGNSSGPARPMRMFFVHSSYRKVREPK